MTYNEEELRKIQKAVSGIFKGTARRAVARALDKLAPKVERAKALSEDDREKAIRALMVEATDARHRALQLGANSYGHPEWAATAACESWLHELAQGDPSGIAAVEEVIDELRDA